MSAKSNENWRWRRVGPDGLWHRWAHTAARSVSRSYCGKMAQDYALHTEEVPYKIRRCVICNIGQKVDEMSDAQKTLIEHLRAETELVRITGGAWRLHTQPLTAEAADEIERLMKWQTEGAEVQRAQFSTICRLEAECDRLRRFAHAILAGTTKDGLYNGVSPDDLYHEIVCSIAGDLDCCPYCGGINGHWEGCRAPSAPSMAPGAAVPAKAAPSSEDAEAATAEPLSKS